MATLPTGQYTAANPSVTDRFAEMADSLNAYLERFKDFGLQSNRAVAQFLCVDSAELSRLKNARVGDINLQRAYEILSKCEELTHRLATFGGPMKCKEVFSVGFTISALPCVVKREQTHAIALQQQTDAALLTVDDEAQRHELDMLLGDVYRGVVHPKRNPYGPMSIMYVLKSVYAAPAATLDQLRSALHVVQLGRRSCQPGQFNDCFDEEVRLRTLAVILNNGGGIALRIAKSHPEHADRMLRLSRYLHTESLATFFFTGTLRGALTCANDLEDARWAKELLKLLREREGSQRCRWPRGIVADLDDPNEWQFLKSRSFWNIISPDAVGVLAQQG